MELLKNHYSKSILLRAYGSISEQNYENHHHFTENIFLKGQNQNFIKERSYHRPEGKFTDKFLFSSLETLIFNLSTLLK